MFILRKILMLVIHLFLFFVLTALNTLLIPELTINKNPSKESFLVAQKKDNEIILTSLKKVDLNYVWFDKNEEITDSEYGGIYIKILEKKDNSEKIELSKITDDYEQIYTYTIDNKNIIMKSYYYRGIGTMGLAMVLSFLMLLIGDLLYSNLKKRLTFNRRMR